MISFFKNHRGFTAAVALYAVATVTWYATLPHLSRMPGLAAWSVVLVCGFFVCALDGRPWMRRAVVLGAVLAVCKGVIHWLAWLAGAEPDLGTLTGSMFIAGVSMPICIGLSIAGGWAGQYFHPAD